MKKIFIMAMAVAAMTLTSCGNKSQSTSSADQTEVSTTLEAAKNVTEMLKEKIAEGDSKAIGEAVQTAVNKLAELVAKGDTEAAKQYQEQIKNFVNENAEKIKEVTGGDEAVSKLIDSFVNVPVKAEEAVQEATEAVKDGAEQIVDEAKEAAEKKVEEAKEAASEKVEEAKQKAEDAARKKVEEAKQKANDEMNKAAEELLKKIP